MLLFHVRGEVSLQSEGTAAQVRSALRAAVAEALGVPEAAVSVAAALAGGRRLAAWAAEWRSVAEGAEAAGSLLQSASSMHGDPSALAGGLERWFAGTGLAFDSASISVGEPVMESLAPSPAPTPAPPTPSPPTAGPTPAPTAPALSAGAAAVASSLVMETESQETSVLDGLFEAADVSEVVVASVGGVASVVAASVATAVGVTAGTVVDAAAVASSGASAVEIPVQDVVRSQVVRVLVPSAVVVQAANGSASVSASVSVGGSAVGIAVTILAGTFPETEAASAQVSVVVRDSRGNELSGVQLDEPVDLVLLENRSEGLLCAWWDGAAVAWSTSGVEEVVHEGPQFICRTHHLSIFTALVRIVSTLERALVCSNSKVFSAEAFKRATSGAAWIYTFDGFVYLLLVLVTVVLMIMSCYLDSRWRRRYEWHDVSFCTTNETLKEERKGIVQKITDAYKEQLDISRISKSLTYHAVAYDQKVAVQSIENLLKGRLHIDGNGTRSSQSGLSAALRNAGERVDAAVDNVIDIANHAVVATGQAASNSSKKLLERTGTSKSSKVDVAREVPEMLSVRVIRLCDTFWQSRWRLQLWIIFVSVNRWVQWHHYSIYDRSTTRGVLLTGQVWGAVAVIALFSENTGSSLSHGSDAQCEANGFWEKVQMDVAVGFWSAIISSAPLAAAQAVLLRRRFVFQSEWEISHQLSYSRWWRTQEQVLLLLLSLYTAACILYVWLFLASVTPMSRLHMTASSISSVFTKVFVAPLGISMGLLFLATVHQRLRPDTLPKIKEDIRRRFESDEMEQMALETISQPGEKSCEEPEVEPEENVVVPMLPGALSDSDDDDLAVEEDALGIVFGMRYEHADHREFCSALRLGLLGMGVGAAGLSEVHVALHESPDGGTVAKISGPVPAIVEIEVTDLVDLLQVAGWKPLEVQPSGHRTRGADRLYRVLEKARQAEDELRAWLEAAAAREREVLEVERFVGAVERLWHQKGQTLLEASGRCAAASSGGGGPGRCVEPLQLETLAEACQKAREGDTPDLALAAAASAGPPPAILAWLAGAVRGCDLDRLFGCAGRPGSRASGASAGAGHNPEVLRAASLAACACFSQVDDLDSRSGRDALEGLQVWVKWLCFLAASARTLEAPMTVTCALWDLPEEALRELRGRAAGDPLFWAAPVVATDAVARRDPAPEPGEPSAVITISGVTRALPLFEMSSSPEEREWLLPPFAALRVERAVCGEVLRLEAACAGCALGGSLLRQAEQDFCQSSEDLSVVQARMERERAAQKAKLDEARQKVRSAVKAIRRAAGCSSVRSSMVQPRELMPQPEPLIFH
ncbi:unnamed protein product [Prorocentrum cordatum]|uniref:GPS domain-containing protein n=1 Tax=Prorocentrum cordatum TaxID=2364126 RepID=A0ABN9TSW0_9DINO|nr:unnamed protein product [Polarella glacialis]